MFDSPVERITATMKTTAAKLNLFCTVIAVGLIVCLFGEHRAWSRVNRANQDLRTQLSQMDSLLADNQRLLASFPTRTARSSQLNQESNAVTAMDEPAKELLRLRGEAEALRQESKAIEAVRQDARQARLEKEARASTSTSASTSTINGSGQTQNSKTDSSGSQLQILQATYWTQNVQTDVTDELRDRIRDDSLKAIASNNLKGDPEFGQVKNLTVVYRYGGVTFTNQFREGALVVLPPESSP
jgi:hypothetical protein